MRYAKRVMNASSSMLKLVINSFAVCRATVSHLMKEDNLQFIKQLGAPLLHTK
jgi:hypothetical protein